MPFGYMRVLSRLKANKCLGDKKIIEGVDDKFVKAQKNIGR